MTAVRAAVTAATVIAAGVAFAVVMVLAVEVFTDFQCACRKGFGHLADIAFGAAHHHDEKGFESIDGTAADTAANEDIHLFFSQQSRQRSVAGTAAGNLFFADNLAVLSFKDRKAGSVAEVLKHLVIFTGNCNFHK